jgi:hypothetical protein
MLTAGTGGGKPLPMTAVGGGPTTTSEELPLRRSLKVHQVRGTPCRWGAVRVHLNGTGKGGPLPMTAVGGGPTTASEEVI